MRETSHSACSGGPPPDAIPGQDSDGSNGRSLSPGGLSLRTITGIRRAWETSGIAPSGGRSTTTQRRKGIGTPSGTAASKLLTPAEAAAILRIKESTLRDYARRGLVPSIKVGRHLRFLEADLEAFVESLRDPK